MTHSGKAAYSRILVKLSGEALMGDGDYGIDPVVIGGICWWSKKPRARRGYSPLLTVRAVSA